LGNSILFFCFLLIKQKCAVLASLYAVELKIYLSRNRGPKIHFPLPVSSWSSAQCHQNPMNISLVELHRVRNRMALTTYISALLTGSQLLLTDESRASSMRRVAPKLSVKSIPSCNMLFRSFVFQKFAEAIIPVGKPV